MHWRHIPLGNDIKFSISNSEGCEWLVFFNGPYPNNTTTFGKVDKKTYYECWGIYFRQITVTTGKGTWWTLLVSFWYPIIMFGILPSIFLIKKLLAPK
jgi:hypothetical protein